MQILDKPFLKLPQANYAMSSRFCSASAVNNTLYVRQLIWSMLYGSNKRS